MSPLAVGSGSIPRVEADGNIGYRQYPLRRRARARWQCGVAEDDNLRYHYCLCREPDGRAAHGEGAALAALSVNVESP